MGLWWLGGGISDFESENKTNVFIFMVFLKKYAKKNTTRTKNHVNKKKTRKREFKSSLEEVCLRLSALFKLVRSKQNSYEATW